MPADLFTRRPVSGDQASITWGPYQAAVASVGASLRSLTYQGRELVAGFEANALRPAFRGAVLVPWPNRIADGRYVFDGVEYQVPLNEPERGNALHGLAIWADWQIGERDASSVTFEYRLVAQQAYPADLGVQATYRLDDQGLHWSVRATNLGEVRAPFALGSHAYLVAGPGHVDDWTLKVPAAAVLEVTPDRLLPVAERPVASFEGGTLDFRRPRAIGSTFIDHAFTDVTARADRLARVELRTPSGEGVAMTWDPAQLPWVQVHTADRPEPELNRSGLAVEPMTCPPDAFNSGNDLIVLEPGASFASSWTIGALGEDA